MVDNRRTNLITLRLLGFADMARDPRREREFVDWEIISPFNVVESILKYNYFVVILKGSKIVFRKHINHFQTIDHIFILKFYL